MAELTENLIRLKGVAGVGNSIAWRLLREFGDSERIFAASAKALTAVRGISEALAGRILAAGDSDPRTEIEKAIEAGITIMPYDDAEYPKPLTYIPDPPILLYVRGRLQEQDQVAVGIVGTRAASPYGRDTATGMASDLARGGYTIVSGLALGVDTFAHIGAMNAGGRTIGVLGCGFDHMYPQQNRDLALEMTRTGAVLTEFSMATPPTRETFPMRNRIIAGLSLGLVVIEAPLRSGALITARLANDFGRTVFAVPGRVGDVRSEGCNKLIRDGAVMVTSVDDIVKELNPTLRDRKPSENAPPARLPGFGVPAAKTTPAAATKPRTPAPPPPPATVSRNDRFPGRDRLPAGNAAPAAAEPPKPQPALSDDERQVMAALISDWQGIDDIIEAVNLPAGKVTALLAKLRLKRLVEQGAGQTYRLR